MNLMQNTVVEQEDSLPPSQQPSSNPTSSPSNAPSSTPSNAPSQEPTNIPTDQPRKSPTAIPSDTPTYAPSMPTLSPSQIPSREPTNIPTAIPTQTPTHEPSGLPSTEPSKPLSNVPTENPVSPTTTGNDTYSVTKSADGVRIRSDLNNAQQIGFLIVFVLIGIILLIRLLYLKIGRYQHTDMPNLSYAIQFVFQIIDVLSDVSVAELMYINDDFEYFYLALIFLILPLIISVSCLFYFKFYQWNLKSNKKMSENYAVPQRITKYFDKYWILLLLWCILSCNFYSAITLSQCKIFCLSMFNLQLKNKEYESLAIIKFINCTICENIGQIILQIFYLQHIGDHSLLVYISLTFSLFSILSQIVIFLTQLNNILIEYNKHVTQILSFDVKIQLFCNKFKSKHEFTNKSIERSLINAFNLSDENDKWSDRGDINVKHEVFFIDGSELKDNDLMDIYFNTTISCYNDVDSIVRNALELTINQLATNQDSKVQKQFLNNIKYCFGFKKKKFKIKTKIKMIENEFKIINKTLIDKEFKNGVLSRLSIWRAAVADTLPSINFTLYQLPQQPKVTANSLELANTSGVTSGYTSDDMNNDNDDDLTDDDSVGNDTRKGTMASNGEENVEIQAPKPGIDDLEYGYDDLNVESEGLAISVPKQSEGEVLTGAV